LGDLLSECPEEVDDFDSVIVVDGIPQVGPERFEKLQSVISKIYNKFGTVINEFYPKTETGQTKG
jgi:translation initiation factor 3 subunit B